MRLLHHGSYALTLVLLLGACAEQDRESTVVSTLSALDQDDETWAAELVELRDKTDEELRTSKTSPMAGTQYLKSDPADEVHLNGLGRTFELAETVGPDTVIRVTKVDDTWHWHDQGKDIICRVGDDLVSTGEALDGAATCEIGDLSLSIYPSTDRVTFIVFDPERPEMKAFDHLLYFPPDRKYAVRARLVEFAEPDEIEMLTSRDLKKTFYRYAKIEFRLDGRDQELSAFKSALTGAGSEYLFIPFRDATTSRETYGAGRFLGIDEPEEDAFVLDFNRAFNPLCNYSPAYNCAIPPRENHLDVAIKAGELTYPHAEGE